MATLAVAAIGAAIGSAIPAIGIAAGYIGLTGAALGWAVGSVVGNYLFAPGTPDIEGPRLSDLTIQTSTYGAAIPEFYGINRTAGNIIWSTNIIETKHTEDVGGKGGGGGGTSTTYTYDISFAVGLGEEIDSVTRIWADGKLVFSAGSTSTPEEIYASEAIDDVLTVYLGTEDQDPDPTIESFEGVGNVPAYRGTSYLVFDQMQLKNYGNRIPNITVEVIANSLIGLEIEKISFNMVSIGHTRPSGATEGIICYQNSPPTVLGSYITIERKCIDFDGTIVGSETIHATAGATSHTGSGGSVHGNKDIVAIFKSSNSPLGIFASFAINTNNNTTKNGKLGKNYVSAGGELLRASGEPLGGQGSNRIGFTITIASYYDDSIYCRFNDSYSIPDSKRYLFKWKKPYYGAADGEYYCPGDISGIFIDDNGAYALCDNGVNGFFLSFDHDLNFIKQWTMPASAISGTFVVFRDKVLLGIPGGGTQHAKFVKLNNNGTTSIIADVQVFGNNNAVSIVGNMLLVGETFIYPIYSDNGVSLQTIVNNFCTSSDLSILDIDTSALTDIVTGYVRTKPMSSRTAIQPLMQGFFFDAVESDWKLKFIKKGTASIATIEKEELAHLQDQQISQLSIKKTQESELPLEVTTTFINQNADYQQGAQKARRLSVNSINKKATSLPIVMDDNYARQISEMALSDSWNTKLSYKLNLFIKYIYLDATDVITINTPNRSHEMMVVKTDFAMPSLYSLESISVDPSIYISSAIGAVSNSNDQTLSTQGATLCVLMNLPSLTFSEINGLTFYYGMSRYYEAWTGAVLYKSIVDGGFQQISSNTVSSVIGNVIIKSNTDNTAIWDLDDTLNVKLIGKSSIFSSSHEIILSGVNAAAYGSNGRWEIIQFVNASLQPDDSYNLTHILRGRKGTEWTSSLHEDNDFFVLLETNIIGKINYALSEIQIENQYKCVTFGNNIDNADNINFASNGENLMPYSPHHLHGERDGSDNISYTWIRRDRQTPQLLHDAPESESPIEYLCEFYNGTILLRSRIVIISNTIYTSGEQITDGITPGITITCKVFQNSSTVDSTHYAEVITQ